MTDQQIAPLPDGLEMGNEFKIERRLGSGGFGITYLVRALTSIDDRIQAGSLYVVKEFAMAGYVGRDPAGTRLVPLGDDDETRERHWSVFCRLRDSFRQEAWTMAKFQHQNIVEVLLVREANETAYIIMEYVNGKPLSSRVDEHKQSRRFGLTWPQLEPIVHQMIDAMEYVHDRNVIHRDIKPDNIMLRANGEAVLIDFGGARTTERARGSMVLTPGFAPVEQWQAFFQAAGQGDTTHEVGPATDIYSMAAAFYYSMTGQPPYALDERGIPTERHPPLLSHPSRGVLELPDRAAQAIDWALDYNDPTKRPQTAREWRQGFPPIGMRADEGPTQPPAGQPPAPADGTDRPGLTAVLIDHPGDGDRHLVRVDTDQKKGGLSTVIGLFMAAIATVAALGLLGYLLVFGLPDDDKAPLFAVQFEIDENWQSLGAAVERGQPLLGQDSISSDPEIRLADLATDERATTISIGSSAPFRIRFEEAGEVRVTQVSDPSDFPKLSIRQIEDVEVRAVEGRLDLVLVNSEFADAMAERN
ncbi:MAG: serine/threonine-protein kinase [Pseudomonadota bacterium]